MRAPRFSVRGLLILAAAVAGLLAYGRHRQAALVRTTSALEAQGAAFSWPDKWHDRLWQRRPASAVIYVRLSPATGRLQLGRRELPSVDASQAEITALERALAEFGVENVHIVYDTHEASLRSLPPDDSAP